MPWIEHAQEHSERIWNYTDIGCAMIALDMTVIEPNQYFATTLEYTTQEMRGKHVDEFTDFPDRGLGVAEIQRVIDGELPYFEQIKTYLTKTGKKIRAHTKSFPIKQGGKIHHFFSVIILKINGTVDLARLAILEAKVSATSKIVEAVVGKDINNIINTGDDKRQQIKGDNNQVAGNDAVSMSPTPRGLIWLFGLIVTLVITLLLFLTETITWPNHNGEAERPEIDIPTIEKGL